MREKLIELVDSYTESLSSRDIHKADFSEKFADYLIANNVMVQQWTPTTEATPQRPGKYLCRCKFPSDMPFYVVLQYYAFPENPHFQHEKFAGMKVTHWLPLPTLEVLQE